MSKLKTLLVVGVLAFTIVLLIGGIGHIQAQMNTIRTDAELTDTTPLLNAPPVVAFTTVALGGFRGLLADWLWLRALRLQESGNYFEMFQLSSWIVKLQPRFTGATAFLAWNMAYNISVSFNGFDDRWRWVRRGIELIRDEALVYNPGDPELYRELGWIYQHKVGKDLDDANRYYKTEMAKDMIRVLGPHQVDWDGLAGSPTSEAKLRTALGPDSEFWTALAKLDYTFPKLEEAFRGTGSLPPEVEAALTGFERLDTVLLCLQNRWLQQEYKLDPALIATLNERYGPLDWRLPDAHAIYWASRGLETADEQISLSCERMIFQALTDAFKTGRLVYIEEIEHLEMSPNWALVDTLDRSYLDAIENHPDKSIEGGYENFLIDAVVILYTFGEEERAREYLEKARANFNAKKYKRELAEFVLEELAADMTITSYSQGQGTVQMYLMQCCYSLALGETERAVAFEKIASALYKKYFKFIGLSTAERRGLPPYPQMKKTAINQAYQVLSPQLRSRLEAALPGFKPRQDTYFVPLPDETEDKAPAANGEPGIGQPAEGGG